MEEVKGAPPRRETELRVGRILIQKLNAEGASWSEPESLDDERARTGAREDGADCLSHGPNGAELLIQVTAPETRMQQQLATAGVADRGDCPAIC